MAFSLWSGGFECAWASIRWTVARLVFFATAGAFGAEDAEITTEELIRRFQRGQTRMFDALFERYKDYVYRVAFFTLRHVTEAEDATQETFLDVLRALPNYDVEGAARFETWLYRVTVNRCRMRMRRKLPPSLEWDEAAEVFADLPDVVNEQPETALLRQERERHLWRRVDCLPEEHRQVLLLRYAYDFSYQEIASAVGISVGTVKSRLHTAHRKLRHLMGE